MKDYRKFLLTCINNRQVLEYSEKEMASYLVNVSEEDYIKFEHGKYLMDDNNLKRIARVLAIENKNLFNLEDYIDTDGLSEEEIEDLSKIIYDIVGEVDA